MIKFMIKLLLLGALLSSMPVLEGSTKGDWRLIEKSKTTNNDELPRIVALTFDDGPGGVTSEILDILKKYGIAATFFFVGEDIEAHKDVVVRAHQEGHAVFNHTWSHPCLTRLTDAEIEQEIQKTQDALTSLVGDLPLIFRPPYGAVNKSVIENYKTLGYKAVFWSIDTRDWESLNADAIKATVINKVTPGDIILMHSNGGREPTAEALPAIIEWLQEQEYSFVRIGDALP